MSNSSTESDAGIGVGQHCVVIGASHAGAQLVASLRQEKWAGKITLIGDEQALPYHRPPLSKAYLAGDKTESDILIRPQSFYEKNDIDVKLGVRVENIDRVAKTIRLNDGSDLSYDKLALATGADVRRLPIPGSDLAGVHYLRDMADVNGIMPLAKEGSSAVIIGGGYIGLETAASLRKKGMKVTVLEAMSRILQRVTTEELSNFYQRIHTEEGVDIRTEQTIAAIEGEGNVSAVKFADGSELAADLVIIGVGVIPNTGLAEKAGLEVGNGIIVDEFATTADPDIVAAGDCTWHLNGVYKREMRLESVQNASEQAKTAAKSICGIKQPYVALPWFWSDQYDLKLQIAGLSQGFDKTVVRGSTSEGRSFAVFYFEGDKLLAVDAINRPKEFMMTKKALTQGMKVDAALLADESADIKDAFTA